MASAFVTGMNQFTVGTFTTKIFLPPGWNAADPNSHFHAHFLGNGENNVSMVENLAPGSLVKNGGPWDGLIYKADGNVARIAILLIHSGSGGLTAHTAVINYCIEQLGIPTTGDLAWLRFQASGISGGPGRFYNFAMNSTSPYKGLFRKRFMLSPVNIVDPYPGILNEDNRGFTYVFYADRDQVVPAIYAQNLYIKTKGKKKIKQVISQSHNSSVWNPEFAITGLNTPNGSTANTNAWRYLTDPYDGIGTYNLNATLAYDQS